MTELLIEQQNDVCTLTLNRPDVGNSFNLSLIEQLSKFFVDAAERRDIRAIVLSGKGKFFCTGADLEWMKQSAALSIAQNRHEISLLAKMYDDITACPIPLLGKVKSAVRGGGVGLISLMDYCVAEQHTSLAMTETRWGLIPGVMMPYVVEKIGRANFMDLALSGRSIRPNEAIKLGLINYAGSDQECDDQLSAIIDEILKCAPGANRALKQNAYRMYYQKLAQGGEMQGLIDSLANLRKDAEAQQGLQSFLKGEKPAWHPGCKD
jgi:methylglutaconyl-CoA hydratase